MEEGQCTEDDTPAKAASDDLNVAAINRMKLAVASAVIRCKPTEMTARQFAESLGQRLRKRQSDWKSKAEKLEAELLKTRQELAVARLREEGQSMEESVIEWDEVGASSNHSQPEAISMTACPEIAFPTPPSSMPVDPPPPDPTLKNHLKTSTQFLHSITRLASLSDTVKLSPSRLADFMPTVRDSALTAMAHLSNYASRHLHDSRLPWKLMNNAISGIVRTLDCCTDEVITREIIKGAMKLVEELLELILENAELNNHHTQHRLASLVVSLSASRNLAPFILHATLSRIQTVAAMLRRSLTSSQTYDPTLYENGSYLLSVMEDGLLALRTVPSTCYGVNQMNEETLKDLSVRLEDCLLHISESFPLFAQCVWRVVGILDWMVNCKSEHVLD